MRSWLTDSEGDIIIASKDIKEVEGKDEIVEQIRAVLGTNQGEWHFNEEYGINYKNLIGKNINELLVEDEIRSGIYQCTGNLYVQDITIERDMQARTMTVKFSAITDTDGAVSREVILYA